jgi:RNA polymerase sigma-70 factor (ECF subfamily)
MESRTRITLLERIRDGADPLAWQAFSDRYWRLIFAFAKNRGCSDHTAEEIVQDSMLEVFRDRDVFSYDPARGRFRDWLGTMVRNLVAKHRRQPAQRIRGRGGDADDGVGDIEARNDQPDTLWETAYEQAMLTVLLDVVRREVSPQTYQAFELAALRGLSGQQTAKITGLSRNAVYLSRKRVFERLRELGTPYRNNGQLHQRVRETLAICPAPDIERSVITRLEHTMQSRRGASQR